MSTNNLTTMLLDEERLDFPEYPRCRRQMAHTEKKDLENLVIYTNLSRKSRKKVKKADLVVIDELIKHSDTNLVADEQSFHPTFSASRHEREWIISYLGPLYQQQMITDVISKVKGGKEANVYCCTAFPGLGVDLVAAKIYRPRMFRSLRNDAKYREGRVVLDEQGKQVNDDKSLHAVSQGSSYGKELRHVSWLGHEFSTLERLHAAGADVPRPYSSSENTILMQYFGEEYQAAATLNEVNLPSRSEAKQLFDRLLNNVDLMLANNCIHGDLSAYNVLYWMGEILIIDFPQAIDPKNNRSSYEILQRDITRICQYFENYGIHSTPSQLAHMFWVKHGFEARWASDRIDWQNRN